MGLSLLYLSVKTNVVLMHVFKEYCALLFFKGALLKDPNGILVRQTKNVQSARQVRFTRCQENGNGIHHQSLYL